MPRAKICKSSRFHILSSLLYDFGAPQTRSPEHHFAPLKLRDHSGRTELRYDTARHYLEKRALVARNSGRRSAAGPGDDPRRFFESLLLKCAKYQYSKAVSAIQHRNTATKNAERFQRPAFYCATAPGAAGAMLTRQA